MYIFRRAATARTSKIATSLLLAMLLVVSGSLFAVPGSRPVRAGDNIWTWTGVNGSVGWIYSHPTNPSTIYAVEAWAQALLRSTDGGQTWIDISEPGWTHVGQVAIAYSSPDVVYVTTPELHRSMDGGDTWQALTLPASPVTGLAVSPADWREVFLMDRSESSSNVYKSIDGGETWSTWSTGLPAHLYFQSDPGPPLTIAPSAPHIMIAKPANTSDERLYKSLDGGRTWAALAGPYHVVQLVVFDPTNSDVIYLGTHFTPGGWKSDDGGATWWPLANGLQPNVRSYVIDPDNTEVIHAANDTAGVLESLDGGASWTPLDAGIQGLAVECVAIGSRSPLVLHAGVGGAGIWEMTRTTLQDYSITIDDGALFTNQTAVTLTLTAPPDALEMMISNDGGFVGAQWEPFAAQKPWTVTDYGGYVLPRVVYAKFRAGDQVSGLYTDDIVLDMTAPTGGVLVGGTSAELWAVQPAHAPVLTSSEAFTPSATVHLPVVVRNARPGFRQASLQLTAEDDVSGVGEMMINTDPAFAGALWQPFETQATWWVLEGAEPSVYVKFRDRAGNVSATFSD